MVTGAVAGLVAALALGFVEALRRFYPSRATWLRLRRARGRLATRIMRERFEASGARRTPRVLSEVLLGGIVIWVAVSPLLDKRWYEVITDTMPWALVGIALFRTPGALTRIAERMKDHERSVGEDPDKDWRDDLEDGDATAIAL